ncbi:MAG: transcriptional regulator [Sphingorhabdus sp.]
MKNIVTVGISSNEDVKERLSAAFRGEPQGNRISFLSVEQMWKTLSPKRTDILSAMTGEGVMSIREVSRRVGRDIKAVHGDVHALINAGVVDRTDKGVVFPYDAVHVDFMLGKAA